MPLLLANTILTVAGTILAETTLSFLGLGDPLGRPGGRCSARRLHRRRLGTGNQVWLLAPGIADHPGGDGLHAGRPRARGRARPQAAGALMSLLELRDLAVTYRTAGGPVPAVRGVSLRLEAGQTLGLAGESGCGKSTIAIGRAAAAAAAAKVTGAGPVQRRGRPDDELGPAARGPLGGRVDRVPGRDALAEPGAARSASRSPSRSCCTSPRSRRRAAATRVGRAAGARSACRRGGRTATRTSCPAGRSSAS